MKYVGAKHLIGRYISKYMHDHVPPDKVAGYLEPFCGSLGVFKQMVKYKYKKFIGSDIQPDIIQMWKELQNGTLKMPKTMSEKQWLKLKDAPSPNALKAVVGFGMSFGGDFFSGYIQKYASGSGRDFYNEIKNSLKKIQPLIQKPNVKFYNKSYLAWHPHNMLIYCDPPYENTKGYSTGDFDHAEFWDTMRKWSKDNYVFISEETAPSDFKVVWRKKKKRTLSKHNRFDSEEKLFVYKGKSKYKTLREKKKKQNKTRKRRK